MLLTQYVSQDLSLIVFQRKSFENHTVCHRGASNEKLFELFIGRPSHSFCRSSAHHVERIFASSFGMECYQSLRAGTSK